MNKNLKISLYSLFLICLAILASCGVLPTNEGDGDPRLSAMRIGARVLNIESTASISGNAAGIEISFSEPMDTISVESSLNIFTGQYTETSPKNLGKLELEPVCNGVTRIRNFNTKAIGLAWKVLKSPEQGIAVVNANSEILVYHSTGRKMLEFRIGTEIQGRIMNGFVECSPKTIAPRKFEWNAAKTEVVLLAPSTWTSQQYTIVLSSGLYTADFKRLEQMYSKPIELNRDGTGDPALNNKPSLEISVNASTNTQGDSGILLTFNNNMNRASVEQALTFSNHALIGASQLPSNGIALSIRPSCNGAFRVSNKNPVPLRFNWRIIGSSELGYGSVPANDETFIRTATGLGKVIELAVGTPNVFSSNPSQNLRAEMSSVACEKTLEFNWTSDSQVTLAPNINFPWSLGTKSIVFSTSVLTTDQKKADKPFLPPEPLDIKPKKDTDPDPSASDPDEEIPEELKAEINTDSLSPLAIGNETIIFEADPMQDENVTYQWNFGDGNTAEGEYAEHQYNNPGTYPVQLLVSRTDEDGVLRQDGIQTEVTVHPTLQEMVELQSLTKGKDTINIDLGVPIPGLRYQWALTDKKGNVVKKLEGTKLNEQFPDLGTYELSFRVMDERDQLRRSRAVARPQSLNEEEQAELEEDNTLATDSTWFTRWETRPVIKLRSYRPRYTYRGFLIIEANTDTKALFGDEGETFRFDAGSSQFVTSNGKKTEFKWSACRIQHRAEGNLEQGQCVPTSQSIQDTGKWDFTPTSWGEYIVTLKLTDAYGQVDTAQRYVSVKVTNGNGVKNGINNQGVNIVFGFDYPTSFFNNYTTANSRLQTQSTPPVIPVPKFPDEVAPGVPAYDAYFPFVLHRSSARHRMLATRWNSWQSGIGVNNFNPVKCSSVRGYWTRPDGRALELYTQLYQFDRPHEEFQPIISQFYGSVYDPYTEFNNQFYQIPPNVLCDFVTNRLLPVQTRSDQEVLFTSNKFWQRAKFDIAEDFRVPRIVMSVLEDDLLPGDGYTPDAEFKMTELEKVTVGGKEELLLQVRMRKSDLTRGELEIKVPVFAVNEKNQLMTNANGIFNARFANLVGSSDCGDCVMVGGQANINVRINPALYDMKKTNPETLELKQLTLWGNNKINANGQPECLTNESDGTPQITSMYLYGCSTIDVNHLAPEGTEFIPESSYPDLENAVQFSPNGKIFVFDDAVRIRQLKGLLKGSVRILYDAIKAIPVVGGFVKLAEYFNKCLEKTPKQNCNVAGILFTLGEIAWDATGGRIISSVAKGIYNQIAILFFESKEAGGVINATKKSLGAFANWIEDKAAGLIARGIVNGDQIANYLGTMTNYIAETVRTCSKKCFTNIEQMLTKMNLKFGKSLEDAVYQINRFWNQYGERIIGYSKDCLSALGQGMYGSPVLFGLPEDLKRLSDNVRPSPITMTLGLVMNKYGSPVVEPAEIDQSAPPIGSPVSPPVLVPAQPSGSPIVKAICAETGKAIRKRVNDEKLESYCDKLMGAKLTNRSRVICDDLRDKALINFDHVMSYFIGMTEGSTAVTTLGIIQTGTNVNIAEQYYFGRRQLLSNNWEAFMYCDETRVSCKDRIPLLNSGEDKRWRLPDYPISRLIQPVIPLVTYNFSKRIARYDQYKPNFESKYSRYLQNFKNDKNDKSQLHHLIADNVAKKVPIVQKAMLDCDWNVDASENMIEMATKFEYLFPQKDANGVVDTTLGNFVEGNKPIAGQGNDVGQVGINFSPVLHLGEHKAFDKYVTDKLNTISPVPVDCSTINQKINEEQTKVRSALVLGATSIDTREIIEEFTASDVTTVNVPNRGEIRIYRFRKELR